MAQDVIVSRSRFLLCSHIFRQVRDNIAGGLELVSGEGNAACGLRPDADGVIHIVISETALLDLFHGEAFCELMNDGCDHLKMSQFLGADVGIEIAHPRSIVKLAHHQC